MINRGEEIGTVAASPSKEFFVDMLTKDISLQDAILDLLDNCVDGIVRTKEETDDKTLPYDGFSTIIEMSAEHFSISDNCGGIPIETARNYAFAIGKQNPEQTGEKAATIGRYGIGMKRAIFKLGTLALVESLHDTGFVVEFTPEWIREDAWNDLPMYEISADSPSVRGTKIEVYELNDETKSAFADREWVDEFRAIVAHHYSMIIGKGFSICVKSDFDEEGDADPIPVEEFKLLRAGKTNSSGDQIAPIIYHGELGEVRVEIYAGLYRKLLTDDQIEDAEDTSSTSNDAGWTVACNDRVVIWKDKSRLTGWGEASVPNFHGQFIAITGLVLLHSDNLKALPLTTTKRGVDASSKIYSEVKDLMREATKNLTSFTNKWKKFPKDLEEVYKSSEYVGLSDLRLLHQSVKMTRIRRFSGIQKFEPSYPTPTQESNGVRVSFPALKSEVERLAHHYFDDPKVKAGEVGEAAFKDAVSRLGDAE
tara:strand:- start:1378 stop:2817 length:1440 start_codon:yes stop_codon:yes gene_type:complete